MRTQFILVGLAFIAYLSVPMPARAVDYAWPLEEAGSVATAFGATYAGSDGQPATHRGADLTAASGDAVLAPCAGVVRFVGRIPALGSSGTQLALTIEADDGIRFTLMPLESADGLVGARLDAGTAVGTVAESGDASSGNTHLHVSARRGDLYVDPLQLLTPPADLTQTGGADPGAQGAGDAGAAASAPRVQPAPPAVGAAAAGAAANAGAASSLESPAKAAGAAAAPLSGAARAGAPERGVAWSASARAAERSAPVAAGSAARQTSAGLAGGATQAPNLAALRSPLADFLASVASRGIPAAAGSLRRLVRAWFVAAIALLAAAGALWPLWRRTPSVGEPGPCTASAGVEIAAAAGR